MLLIYTSKEHLYFLARLPTCPPTHPDPTKRQIPSRKSLTTISTDDPNLATVKRSAMISSLGQRLLTPAKTKRSSKRFSPPPSHHHHCSTESAQMIVFFFSSLLLKPLTISHHQSTRASTWCLDFRPRIIICAFLASARSDHD